jgi:hypothetical protein
MTFQRRIFPALVTIFAIWALYLCVGITIELSPQTPLSRAVEAKATWDVHGISDYQMEVGFSSFGFVGSFLFTIQDNKVMDINVIAPLDLEEKNLLSFEDSPPWYRNFENVLPSSLEVYTIDELFTFAVEKIQHEPAPPVVSWCAIDDSGQPHYEATFDAKLGYITSLSYTNCPNFEIGGGLLCPYISECAVGFLIRNLTPLSQ